MANKLIGSVLFILCAASAAAQSVLINEFVPRNLNGIVDEKGEHEDWVELHNPTSGPITISGMYLTDNMKQPTRWKIPLGVTLQPNATALIWCDNEPLDGPLHASFRIDNDGEELGLFDKDGKTLLDTISWEKVRTDHSGGRMFDGKPLWVSFPKPTPRKPNAPTGCGDRRYSSLETRLNTMKLKLQGTAKVGTAVKLEISDAPVRVQIQGFLALKPTVIGLPIMSAHILMSPPIYPLISGTSDALGAASMVLPIPSNPYLSNLTFYTQCWTFAAGNLHASNGLEISICK